MDRGLGSQGGRCGLVALLPTLYNVSYLGTKLIYINCKDWKFELGRRNGRLSFVSVVSCHVAISVGVINFNKPPFFNS